MNWSCTWKKCVYTDWCVQLGIQCEFDGRWDLNNYRIMAPGACQKTGSTTSGCTPRLAASSFLFLPLPPAPLTPRRHPIPWNTPPVPTSSFSSSSSSSQNQYAWPWKPTRNYSYYSGLSYSSFLTRSHVRPETMSYQKASGFSAICRQIFR